MGKIAVKDWKEIQSDFEQMASMSCVPVGLKKVPANHIFDEDKSVKWNREQVERNNAEYQNEVKRLNTEKNKRRDSILTDIYTAIQNEVGHGISLEKAKSLWDYAYEQGHSYGIHDVMCNLYEIMDLASTLLG